MDVKEIIERIRAGSVCPPNWAETLATDVEALNAELKAYQKFADRVCAGDVGNQLLLDKCLVEVDNERSE